ncbi:MAG: ABC transporter ATP-binding protein [Campylobacteraceae bacterium]|nr:ABC transporter ATP-binding protein [Campylobacteraceae bacterium]
MIRVENLTKIYHLYQNQNDRLKEALSPLRKSYHENFYALKDVSFNISKGEIVGIIGNNGSGKSTLLKIITGVLTQSLGRCSINGKITALLELGAGFSQELTGLQNIYLHGAISGYKKDEMSKKVDEIIAFAEIGEFMYQAVKTYSSGMKSRLAFAMSINVNPEIFIVDEVLSVGDAAFQRKCFAKIESFKEQGKTILFVSHSIGQVIQLCNSVIWLNQGEKVIEGETKRVTGLYQKYGSSQILDMKKIRDEFHKRESTEKKVEIVTKKSQAYFNEKLKSKSKIVYEENGAKISNVKLLSDELQEVNIAQKGLYYYYSYDVEFDKSYDEVRLAMLVKTKNGIEIGGKEIPLIKSKTLSSIQAGKTYKIRWKFKNIFNVVTYFFNCGVNTVLKDEKVVLHRILDAYMFEVVQEKDDYSNNIIDFDFKLAIKKSHE